MTHESHVSGMQALCIINEAKFIYVGNIPVEKLTILSRTSDTPIITEHEFSWPLPVSVVWPRRLPEHQGRGAAVSLSLRWWNGVGSGPNILAYELVPAIHQHK